MKLQTKLQYVDIHSYWLIQEVQRGSIYIRWVPTKEMVADGLTKALSSAQKHDSFVRRTGIEDQKDLLASIKTEKDALQQLRTDPEYSEVYGFGTDATWYIFFFFFFLIFNVYIQPYGYDRPSTLLYFTLHFCLVKLTLFLITISALPRHPRYITGIWPLGLYSLLLQALPPIWREHPSDPFS